MSRNGRARGLPLTSTRMRPPCSTTNRRLRSPGGLVTYTGDWKLPIRLSRTPRAAALAGAPGAAVAVPARSGEGVASGAAPLEPPPQPRTAVAARTTGASARALIAARIKGPGPVIGDTLRDGARST